MEERIFYEKIGNEFVPVNYYDADVLDSIPFGHILISRTHSGSWNRQSVEPAMAPLIAAIRMFRDELVQAIHAEGKYLPRDIANYNPTQLALWKELERELGNSLFSIQAKSVYAIVETATEKLAEDMSKLLENPQTKTAYEEFLLIAKLSGDI